MENLRALFAEVRRVLADDGTLWLNLGDSYSSKTKGSGGSGASSTLGVGVDGSVRVSEAGRLRGVARQQFEPRRIAPDVPDKNLLGMPWRVAFALQDDGWILRNSIIWAKPNAMPESVTDRLSTKHEHVFLLSKRPRYWFDLDAIKVPLRSTPEEYAKAGASVRENHALGEIQGRKIGAKSFASVPEAANPGDVWTIPTAPFPGAHFAVFPPALAERCILAGAKPGGIVLDPFSGSGTTGLAAAKHGRRYVGIDLNADYLDLSLRTRLQQPALDFGEATA